MTYAVYKKGSLLTYKSNVKFCLCPVSLDEIIPHYKQEHS